jgi:cell division inhibitor SulA
MIGEKAATVYAWGYHDGIVATFFTILVVGIVGVIIGWLFKQIEKDDNKKLAQAYQNGIATGEILYKNKKVK